MISVPKKSNPLSKIRSQMYDTARTLGDLQAIASGDPDKILKRILRKTFQKKMGSLVNNLFK